MKLRELAGLTEGKPKLSTLQIGDTVISPKSFKDHPPGSLGTIVGMDWADQVASVKWDAGGTYQLDLKVLKRPSGRP